MSRPLTRATEVPWWKEPTRRQWFAFLAAWSGWVLDAFDFTIFFLVMKEIGDEFGVSTLATTGSITLTLIARLAGGFAAGSLADRYGRRLPLMLSIVGFSLCDGLVALAPSFAFVLVMRTLFGFFMGAEWTAGTTLAMESWPARSRGIASGILQGSWAVGYLLAAPVYGWVVPVWGWRGLFVVAALPALLILPIRFLVRESPEWQRSPREHAPRVPFRQLIAIPGWASTVMWSTVIMACGFGVYYGLAALYPTLLKTELGAADSVAPLTALFNVGMLVGAVITGWLAGKRGPIPAIAIPALLMIPFLPLYVGAVPELLPLGAFLAGAVGVGFCGVTPLLLTSLFAPEVRARSVGLVYHLGAIPAAFAATGIAMLSQATGMTLAVTIAVTAGALELLLATALIIARFKLGAAPAQPAEPSMALDAK
ncbi:MAG TPA: MFS transporter [Kofleriaceae bacterium]|nr:MFS transporter [Kofleriaceae bacterium]